MDCSKIQNAFDIHPLYWKEGLVKMLDRLYNAGRGDRGFE
jgi:hypothetical protein